MKIVETVVVKVVEKGEIWCFKEVVYNLDCSQEANKTTNKVYNRSADTSFSTYK